MEDYLTLYHATDRKKAINIVKTQQFIVEKDDENRKLLGEGAYFYDCRQDAIEWNSRDLSKKEKNIFPEIKEMNDMYAIIEATVDIKENEILNLDNRDDIIKYKKAVEIIKKALSLKNIDNYNEKNLLGTILNFLYKNNKFNKKMVIKTIPYTIPYGYGVKIYKKIFCIKDTETIVCFKLSTPIDWNEYNKMKKLYS